MIQGFLTIQTINLYEKFIFMGNKMKALLKGVGSCCLIIDIGHHLDLLKAFMHLVFLEI